MNGISKLEWRDDITLVSFHQIPYDITTIAQVFSLFSQHGINIDMVTQSAMYSSMVDVAFTCDDADMIAVLEITNQLADSLPHLKPMVSSGNTKIQLYGEEMRETPGVFACVMNCLRDTEAFIGLITTSEVDISVLVDTPHVDQVLAVLEETFDLA